MVPFIHKTRWYSVRFGLFTQGRVVWCCVALSMPPFIACMQNMDKFIFAMLINPLRCHMVPEWRPRLRTSTFD